MKSKIRSILYSTLVISGISLLAGCTKATDSSGTPPNSQTPTTYITLMNLAAYSPIAYVLLNGTAATAGVAPGAYSGSYGHIPAGTFDVKFEAAGTDSLLADIPASAYDSLKFYTLVLYNSDTVHKTAQAVKIADDFSAVQPGFTYYRFLDFCPEIGPVDVYLNNSLVQGGRSAADVVANPVYTAFTAATSTGYNIAVKKAGTDSVLYTLPNTPFMAGNAYTLFFAGTKVGTNFPIAIQVLQAAY